MGSVRAVSRFCELYPGICLTTEERARINLSQDSRRVPVGTMKREYTDENIECTEKNIEYTEQDTEYTERNINIQNIEYTEQNTE